MTGAGARARFGARGQGRGRCKRQGKDQVRGRGRVRAASAPMVTADWDVLQSERDRAAPRLVGLTAIASGTVAGPARRFREIKSRVDTARVAMALTILKLVRPGLSRFVLDMPNLIRSLNCEFVLFHCIAARLNIMQ